MWSQPKSGIPQGTVLGPILFQLFIDDCPIELQTRDLERGCLFVDDIALYSTGDEKSQVKDLTERLTALHLWAVKWGVKFNLSKTKHMVFLKRGVQSTVRVQMVGKVLEKVDSYKYLGLTFSSNLKFDEHAINYLIPRVKKEIGKLKGLLKGINTGRCTFLRVLP